MITKELALQAKNQVQTEFMEKEFSHGIAIGSKPNDDGLSSYAVTMFTSNLIQAQQDFGDFIEVTNDGSTYKVPIKYVQMGCFKPETA